MIDRQQRLHEQRLKTQAEAQREMDVRIAHERLISADTPLKQQEAAEAYQAAVAANASEAYAPAL